MTGYLQADLGQAPNWLLAEMPPGYRTRLLEIERLSSDLQVMDGIGRVLWETGEPLRGAVRALFAALKCDADGEPGAAGTIVVNLGDSRRLLLLVSCASAPIERTHEELAAAFQAVQFAGAADRVVFVSNNDPATPPPDRPNPILGDALAVLERMGVNALTTATLFRLWRLSLEDAPKARKALDRLHVQDGGEFVVPR